MWFPDTCDNIYFMNNPFIQHSEKRSMVRDASNRRMEDGECSKILQYCAMFHLDNVFKAPNHAHTSGGEGIVDSMQDATKIESATTAQAWRTQKVCTNYAEVDEH